MYRLISFMKAKGMSWRRISAWLNSAGIKTHSGKSWSLAGSSAHSVVKRMRQRIKRIEQVKNREFDVEISGFNIENFN